MSFDVIARDRCRRTVESGPACGFQAFLEEEASVVGASSCWHENKVLARVVSQSEGPKMEDQGKAFGRKPNPPFEVSGAVRVRGEAMRDRCWPLLTLDVLLVVLVHEGVLRRGLACKVR